MKSNRLAEIILNPSACTREEISEIAALAEQFPYSSAIHILNAKLATLNNSEGKDTLLTRAAISTPDRMKLKQFITTNEIFADYQFIKSDSEQAVSEAPAIPIEETVNEIQEKAPETAVEPEKDMESVPDITVPPPEQKESEISDELSAEQTGREVPPAPEKQKVDDPDISAAVIHSIDKDSIPRTEQKGYNVADEVMKNLASYKELKAKVDYIIEDSGNTSHSAETEKSDRQTESDEDNEIDPPANAPIDNMEDVEEKFREIIKPIRKKKSTKKMGKDEQDKLISKFIETDSTSSKQSKPGNRDKKSEEDLSLPSSELKDEMITETLANIMVNQGKLDKAIDIYRKLIWKLPQKKAYFAAKIESLKEKISKK